MGRSRAAYGGERHERDQEPNFSIVPAGTEMSFCNISHHFVLGYFHRVPPGQSSSHAPKSYVDADRQPPDGVGFRPAIGPIRQERRQANFRANSSSAFLTVYDSRFKFRRVITGVSFSIWRLPLTSTPAWRLNRK
jgi:hypothetical protein